MRPGCNKLNYLQNGYGSEQHVQVALEISENSMACKNNTAAVIIYSQYYSTLDDGQLHIADFLSELIDVRDNRHEFADNLSLSYDEVNDIILYVCTC